MAAREFIFLGTGTSTGVPMVGCDCSVCRSSDPRNHRYRTSALLRLPHGNADLVGTLNTVESMLRSSRSSTVCAVVPRPSGCSSAT